MIARWTERLLALGFAMTILLLLRLRPLPDVLALCDRIPVLGHSRRDPRSLAHRAHRWLSHGQGPWASTCLTRSIVLYAWLRQHGYSPRFTVGVAGVERDFDAHAWVSLGGIPVIDAPEKTESYVPLVVHGA